MVARAWQLKNKIKFKLMAAYLFGAVFSRAIPDNRRVTIAQQEQQQTNSWEWLPLLRQSWIALAVSISRYSECNPKVMHRGRD